MAGSHLRDAVAQLMSGLQDTDGIVVTYTRGASSVDVTAVPGTTEHQSYGPEGELITSRSADWLVRASDLVLDNQQTLPQRGDTITADGRTWIVLPVGDDRCYRFSDQFRVRLRIYTIEQ